MAEYIKKDELLKFKADVYDEDGHLLYAVPTGCIVAMPPADVAPVRHGRWMRENNRVKSYIRICSECRKTAYFCGTGCSYNYCPNCGAKMDGTERN